jgi:hypothetical protein
MDIDIDIERKESPITPGAVPRDMPDQQNGRTPTPELWADDRPSAARPAHAEPDRRPARPPEHRRKASG